jgi:hypothetical protein
MTTLKDLWLRFRVMTPRKMSVSHKSVAEDRIWLRSSSEQVILIPHVSKTIVAAVSLTDIETFKTIRSSPDFANADYWSEVLRFSSSSS